MSAHTPTPWAVGPHPGHVMTETRRLIANCRSYSSNVDGDRVRAENDSNAAFIARACNSHEALVEALRRALRYFEDASNGREPANRLMQALRDALAESE